MKETFTYENNDVVRTRRADGTDNSFVGKWVSPELVNATGNLQQSLFGGIANIISAANNKSTTTTTNTNINTESEHNFNSKKWIAIAAGATVVLVVVLVLIFKKRN